MNQFLGKQLYFLYLSFSNFKIEGLRWLWNLDFCFFCLHSVGGCCETLEIENYEQVGRLLQWLTSCLQSRPFTFDQEKLALNESFPLKCRQVHIHDFTCFLPVVLLYFMY